MQPRRSWPDWLLDAKEKDDNDEDLASCDTATTDTGETETLPREVTMDDYFFKEYVRACRNVVESTSYLEIFNYSVRLRASHPRRAPPPTAGRRDRGLRVYLLGLDVQYRGGAPIDHG